MFIEMQINYLLWLQNLREILPDFFNTFFISITYFGEIFIPILFAACIYWAINRKIGEYLLMAHACILMFCQLLKMLFCIQRPWILNEKIVPYKAAIKAASGYSFPSGHTSCAMAIWGGLIVKLWDKKIVRYTLITLILLIAFSRNYLGVHTPQDVIVAIIVGLIILLFMNKTFDKDENATKYFMAGIGLSIIIPLIIFAKSYFLTGSIHNIQSIKSCMVNIGYSIGIITGWYLAKYAIRFDTINCSVLKRCLRIIFGIISVVICVKQGEIYIIGDAGGYGKGFIYAGFVGFYITAIYPWIFSKIEEKLAKNLEKSI